MSQPDTDEARVADRRSEETRSFVRQVRAATRRKYTPEEKTRIVLEGFRREVTVNDLCRREGIKPHSYYAWTKEFMEVTCPPRTGPGVMLVLGLKERGVKMARRKHTAEQIINKLREAEVAISAGSTVAEVSRQIGVTQQTFYRWRTEYGGLKIDQARRLKQLETENGRLRRAVADLTLDDQILREAAEGNF